MLTSCRNSRYTLIELLVVVAVLSFLGTLLHPSLSKAMVQAKLALCSSHLKQLSMVTLMYIEDYSGWFMTNEGQYSNGSWDYKLSPYDGRDMGDYKRIEFSEETVAAQKLNQGYLCPADDLSAELPESQLRKTYTPSAYQPESSLNTSYIRKGLVPQRTIFTDKGILTENIQNVTKVDKTLLFSGNREDINVINTSRNTGLISFVRVKNAHNFNEKGGQMEKVFIHEEGFLNAVFLDGHVKFMSTFDALENSSGKIPIGSTGQNTMFDARRDR